MTAYDTTLAIGKTNNVDFTLIIDGIPLSFGTRAGIVHDTSASFDDGNTYPFAQALISSLTSVDAITSLSVDGSKLDYDMLMVQPAGASVSLRASTTWDKYFERRRSPRTYLTAAMTAAATSATVSSSSGISNGTMMYVDRESIYVNTAVSSLTRNYAGLPGSSAAVHLDGAIVSGSPRYLVGRSAVLFSWINGTAVSLYRRLKISNIKYNGNAGTWDITFSDAMALFDRQLATGWKGAQITRIVPVTDGTWEIIPTYGSDLVEFVQHGDLGHIMLTGDDGEQSITEILGWSASGNPIIAKPPMIPDDVASLLAYAGQGFNLEKPMYAKRVYVMTGSPMVCALKAMLSDRGDGTVNATYDTLVGITTSSGSATSTLTDGNQERRFGAAIPSLLLDLDTLTANNLIARTPPGWFYVLGARGQESLLELLEEVAWALGGYWYIDSSGRLSFRMLSAVYPSTTVAASITEDEIIRTSSLMAHDDESEIIQSVKLECNYDHLSGKHFATVNITYPWTSETFRDTGKTLGIKRKGLVVKVPGYQMLNNGLQFTNPASVDDISMAMMRMWTRREDGIRKYSITVPFKYHTLIPGRVVSVTHSALNSFAGGTLSANKFEVVSVGALDMKNGTVELELHETFTGKPISPTGKVSSWNAGTNTLTLATSSKFGGGTTPADYFAAGWKVRVLDKSASPPFSTASAVLTVSSKTTTDVTLSGAPAFTPAAGDLLVMANYDDSDSTTTSTAESIGQRDHAFMGDANFRLGTSSADADVWG